MRRALAVPGLLLLWCIPGLLSASATLILFPNSPTIGGNVQRFLIVSLLPWTTWALLTPAVIAFAHRVPIERERLARTASLHLTAGIVCALVFVLGHGVTSWIITRYFPVPMRPPAPGVTVRPQPQESVFMFARGAVASRFPVGLIVYAMLAGIGMSMHERQRRRARESHAARLEADLARAELQMLQMQLQPHFLFNTLHAISVLVTESPKAASRMIAQLGDLLRETLRLSGTPEVPLDRELDLLRQYLAIEETRLGERLHVEFAIPHDLAGVLVPTFVLQPIVENAVRHGIAPQVQGGTIRVSASRAGDRVRIVVSDDGPGFGPSRDGGMGLASTRERLARRYGAGASLHCETGANGGAIVSVELPFAHG